MKRIARYLCVSAALGLAMTAAWGARAEGPLVELSTSDEGKDWQAVGRINLGGAGYCTGALIAPNLVLTAAHCLYNPNNGVLVPIEQIEFLAGWRNGRAAAYRRVKRTAAHPDYIYDNSNDSIERVAFDVALLELDNPIRNAAITPFATSARPRTGDEVGIVSYATGRDDAPSLEEVCNVLASHRSVVMLSCDVDFGASGAPIFIVQDGEVMIVSVVSAKAEVDTRRVALAAELGETLATVRRLLEVSDGVFQRTMPQVRTITTSPGNPSGGAKFVQP